MLVVILALIAHVGYACNDFSAAVASRKMDAKLLTLMSWVFGSIIYTMLAPFFLHPKFELLPMLVLGFLAVLFTVAYPVFMKSVEGGNATVSGVVAGTFPLWTVIFSIIFYNERLTGAQILASLVILAGIILSALHLTRKTRLHNLLNYHSFLAFTVSLMWGLGFALWKYPAERLGWFETSYFNSLIATVVAFVLFYPSLKGRLRKEVKRFYMYPLVNTLTGSCATLAYSYALTKGNLSVIAPIAGSYSGLYAILSYIKFREALTKIQITGVVLILVGVVALSVIVSRS